jgi:hypothetical protein
VPRKPWSSPWLIAGAFAAAAIVSWLGALLADRPGIDAAAAPLATRIGLMLGFGACAAVAAVAYLRALGAHGESGPVDRRLVHAAIAIHVVAAAALPLTSNDAFSNLAYGRLAHLGTNPYLAGPAALPAGDPFAALVGVRWNTMPIVYGPLATLLDALVVGSRGVWPALVAFKGVLLATSLATVAIAWRACRDRPAAFVAVAWNPLLAWEISAQAHNDGLLVVALAAAVWAGAARREGLAAVLAGVAVLAKLAAAPILALQLWALLRRAPARAIAAALVIAGLTVASFAIYWAGLATLDAPLLAAGGAPGRTARSLVDLVWLATAPLGVATVAYRVLWAAGVVVLLAAFVRAMIRTRTFADAIHESITVMIVWNLVTPWFQPWYAAWLLPLVMIERDARTIRLVVIYTALLVVQYALPIDPLTNVAIDAWVVVEALAIRRGRPAPSTAAGRS